MLISKTYILFYHLTIIYHDFYIINVDIKIDIKALYKSLIQNIIIKYFGEEIIIKIGSKLRKLRKNKGFTLEEVGSAVGLDQGYLSKMERNGTKYYPIRRIKKLTDFYGVSFLEFLEKDDCWQDVLSDEFQEFLTEENRPYLNLAFKMKKKGLSVSEAESILEIISSLFIKIEAAENLEKTDDKYYELAVKAKDNGISLKQLNQIIDAFTYKASG